MYLNSTKPSKSMAVLALGEFKGSDKTPLQRLTDDEKTRAEVYRRVCRHSYGTDPAEDDILSLRRENRRLREQFAELLDQLNQLIEAGRRRDAELIEVVRALLPPLVEAEVRRCLAAELPDAIDQALPARIDHRIRQVLAADLPEVLDVLRPRKVSSKEAKRNGRSH